MTNKVTSALIITILLAVFGLWFVQTDDFIEPQSVAPAQEEQRLNAPETLPQNHQKSLLKPKQPPSNEQPDQRQPDTQPSPQTLQTSETATEPCDVTTEKLSPDLEYELASYFNNLLGWDFTFSQYNEYLDYDEATLKTLAQSGDARAMFTLGVNYRWYAQFTNFESPLIRKDPMQTKPQKREALELELMHQAIYWLEQAAYHGLPTALLEQKHAFAVLLEANAPHPLVPDEEALKLRSIVIEHFIHQVVPDYSLVSFNIGNLNSLEAEQQQSFEQDLQALSKKWQQQREQLQLPQTIELSKSPQLLTLLSQMQQCMSGE